LVGEVDVRALAALAVSKGKKLCLPRVDWTAGTMDAVSVPGLGGLERSKHGLMQPGPGAPVVPPDHLDLILVPGLAFDAVLRRFGRGAGYYDRFLARAGQGWGGAAVGVAFEVQIVDALPSDAW